MELQRAIHLLKECLNKLDHLRSLHHDNEEQHEWRSNFYAVAEAAFDKNSEEYRQINNLPVVRVHKSDKENQEEYWRELTQYETIIRQIIQKYEIPSRSADSYVKERSTKMEREYYKTIKERLEQTIKTKFSSFHLEITANKHFSNKLKAQVSQNREIIFSFMKEAAPDITGFIKMEYSTDFLIVEFKPDTLKLDDIYQARKYGELFDARYGLLISIKEIPEEIKRLHRVVYSLLSLPAYKTLTIVHYDENSTEFLEWFPANPFE